MLKSCNIIHQRFPEIRQCFSMHHLKLTHQHIRVFPQDYDTAVPVLSALPVQNQQLLSPTPRVQPEVCSQAKAMTTR